MVLKKVKYAKIRGKSVAIETYDNHIRIVPIEKGMVDYILNGFDAIAKEQKDSDKLNNTKE